MTGPSLEHDARPQPGVTVPVLVVEDEPTVRDALTRFLRTQGFDVHTAADGGAALEHLRGNEVSLMLLDIRMPGMSGIDVVPEALDVDPDLAIIMLTGMTDATSAATCMQRGAMDYLTKPIELTELSIAVHRCLRRRDTIMQGRRITTWLHEEVERRGEELEYERQKQEQMTVATLEALVNALEAKSPYLGGHSSRVAALSATIAHQLGLTDDEVERVRIAGRLHDLGVIGIREEILNKAGKLSPEEYDHIKQHVVIGSRILAPLTHLGPVADFVRGHHERWDGGGYPDGLAGERIPLGARIIGAGEVYDALTTSRPYREKLSPDDAATRMGELSGKALDPEVVEALAMAVSRRQTLAFLDEDHVPGV